MFKVSTIFQKFVRVSSKFNLSAASFSTQRFILFHSGINLRNLPLTSRGGPSRSEIFSFPVVLGSILAIALCECENLHDKCSVCGMCKNHCANIDDFESKSKCILCSCNQKPITWDKQDVTHDLTHGFLLKQANIVTIDSVTRIISETVSAIDDYNEKYRQHLKMLMDLMEDSRGASENRQELLHCKMIVVRSTLADMKNSIIELECYFESVQRLSHAAAESAFLAQAEYAGIALNERLNTAMTQIKVIKEKTYELERASNELQSLVIIESGEGLK